MNTYSMSRIVEYIQKMKKFYGIVFYTDSCYNDGRIT